MGLKEKFETRKSIESLPNLASNKLELIKSIKDSCVKINTFNLEFPALEPESPQKQERQSIVKKKIKNRYFEREPPLQDVIKGVSSVLNNPYKNNLVKSFKTLSRIASVPPP
jgi:hypothetical protein